MFGSSFLTLSSIRRWLRLLFGREFALEETLTMWDALFAFQPHEPLELVDFVALAMIIDIRDERTPHFNSELLKLNPNPNSNSHLNRSPAT